MHNLDKKIKKRIKSLNFTMEEYLSYLIYNDINSINDLNKGYYYNSTLKKVINPNHEDVNLTNTQLRIIKILVDNREEILDADTIVKSAWDKNEVSIFTLRNMIKQIRDKTYYGIIKSHSNKGYSLG